jgi:tRNA(fMet)-specific endonuclease VapC
MTLWVLDTDHVSLFQTGHPSVTQKIQSIWPNDIAVTIITLEEQMYGRLNKIRKAKSIDELAPAYLSLNRTVVYFQTINVLDFDQRAAICYREIVAQKIRVGTQDLKIAAIALSREAIVVTRNSRDFSKVPGLQITDWTIKE